MLTVVYVTCVTGLVKEKFQPMLIIKLYCIVYAQGTVYLTIPLQFPCEPPGVCKSSLWSSGVHQSFNGLYNNIAIACLLEKSNAQEECSGYRNTGHQSFIPVRPVTLDSLHTAYCT